MNNPVLPILDGLLGLSQTFADNASQKNWAEIEDLEKEQGAPGANARQQLSAGTSLSTYAGPADVFPRLPAVLESGAEPGAPSRHDIGEDGEAQTLPRVSATGGEKAVSQTQPQSQQVSGPDWQNASDVTLLSAPTDVQNAQAVTAATDGIEHGLATTGPVAASQKLHAAIRALSPPLVSALLDTAAPVIARLVEQAVRGEDGGGVASEKPREVRTALVLAHVAAALDKDPRHPSSIRLSQDIGAIVLGAPNLNDNTTFSGLARTIGIGAGARLVLAIAAELAHRDENFSRARALILIMLSAFGTLGERIDATYSQVLQQAGPLCLEWLAWRDGGEERALDRLVALLQQQPGLLDDLAPKLERLEQTGLEAFRAVRDLSAFTIDPKLDDVRTHFLGSQSVFASIAGSRTALRDIRHTAAARVSADADVTLDLMRLTLTDIGFEAPKAAFLAELGALDKNALILGANWTALQGFDQMEVQGRAFQRLLAFLNGQFVMAATPDVIGFDDDDMQV